MYWKQTASVLTSTGTSEVKRGRMCAVPHLVQLVHKQDIHDLAGVRTGGEE